MHSCMHGHNYGIPILTKLSMLNICAKCFQIYGQTFYVFNHANTLSNGMPIYGQTVQYIWSNCVSNIWANFFMCLTMQIHCQMECP